MLEWSLVYTVDSPDFGIRGIVDTETGQQLCMSATEFGEGHAFYEYSDPEVVVSLFVGCPGFLTPEEAWIVDFDEARSRKGTAKNIRKLSPKVFAFIRSSFEKLKERPNKVITLTYKTRFLRLEASSRTSAS